jgi:hypothetical protein
MAGSADKPDPVTAYRELESVTTSLLAACEREEVDAMLAEIGRREEVQKRLGMLEAEDIGPVRDEILPILERIKALDEKIEPTVYALLDQVRERIRSASNSRKLLEHYLKEPHGTEAKFFDRRG